jgi:hypothetical protein
VKLVFTPLTLDRPLGSDARDYQAPDLHRALLIPARLFCSTSGQGEKFRVLYLQLQR